LKNFFLFLIVIFLFILYITELLPKSEPLGIQEPTTKVPYMPGRLKNHLDMWRKTTQDPFVLSVISSGYKITWLDLPPLPTFQKNSPNCFQHVDFITKSICEAESMGVIVETTREFLNNVSPLNVDIKKSNGKRRLIFNAMKINLFMSTPKFKYPQLQKEGREIFRDSDWAYVCDISQAFYHIEIHPTCYKYLGFSWNDKYYYWRCCPFGVSFGPWLWDRILAPVLDHLKKNSLKIMAFCDDILGGDKKKLQADEDGLRLVSTLQVHGYIVHPEKCQGVGNSLQIIPGLGMIINCKVKKYFMTPKRETQIVAMCQTLMSNRLQTARRVSQTAGVIMSQIAALGPIARIRTRSMYACIQSRLLPGETSMTSASYDRVIFIDDKTYEECAFWVKNVLKYNGRDIDISIIQFAYHCLTASDASATGYGGFLQIPLETTRESMNKILQNLDNLRISVTMSQAQQGLDIWGSFTPEQCIKSSSWRELYGTGKLFEIFGSILTGTIVPIYLDSQVAVMNLGGSLPQYPDKIFGGSKKDDLQELVVWIYNLAEIYNFGIHAIWIPRHMNERSDFNSHLNEYDHYDFSLKIDVFQYVESCFGPHSVDRFASAMSTQLFRFNTKYYSPLAEAIDAFSLDWGNNENNYVFPPPALVGQAIRHAQRCRAIITLVFMEWYSRPYMATLFPREGNICRKSVIFLGHSSEVLEYKGVDADIRLHHLPKGNVYATRLDYR
jgi:hypothetical protein